MRARSSSRNSSAESSRIMVATAVPTATPRASTRQGNGVAREDLFCRRSRELVFREMRLEHGGIFFERGRKRRATLGVGCEFRTFFKWRILEMHRDRTANVQFLRELEIRIERHDAF